jgi:hypothetical protein
MVYSVYTDAYALKGTQRPVPEYHISIEEQQQTHSQIYIQA